MEKNKQKNVSDGKESTCNVEDLGSIPGLGRSPGGGHGHPLSYACLENPRDGGAWQATVHGVTAGHSWVTKHSTAHSIKKPLYCKAEINTTL